MSAPCPAVSRMLQLPRIRPFGKLFFFFMYSCKLPTIVSVGFSETPWNFLKPVTWIITAGGPSDPIYQIENLTSYSIKVGAKSLNTLKRMEWNEFNSKHKQ